jgi:S-adenosylmethionine hydrolase
MPPIALISDLGTRDYFVPAMKGVILSINPNALIVDITHELPKGNIAVAAFTLVNAIETFPGGSIAVAVVDPGVGTKRKCILVETGNKMFFVGPDNGIFTLVAERFKVKGVYEITNSALMRPSISSTFHGRDIMAPVAAHLSLGLNPSEVGPRLRTFKKLKIPRPKLVGDRIFGRVLNIDDFGNIVLNIDAQMASQLLRLNRFVRIGLKGKEFVVKFVRTFGDVKPGECLCYIGSAGLLEVAKNMGNLAAAVGAELGDEVSVEGGIKK